MNSDIPVGSLLVGIKQSTKAVKEGTVLKAFVANGIDITLRNSFVKLCKKKGVPLEVVKTSGELGAMCGIDVGASVAVITAMQL